MARSRTAFPTAGFLRSALCKARPSAAPALPSGGRRGTCSAGLRCAFTAAPLPGARTGQTSDRGVNVEAPEYLGVPEDTLSKPPEGQAIDANAVKREKVLFSHRNYNSSMSNLDMRFGS
ncbi:unnamed protein product [Coccothraustes coccothraustes]